MKIKFILFGLLTCAVTLATTVTNSQAHASSQSFYFNLSDSAYSIGVYPSYGCKGTKKTVKPGSSGYGVAYRVNALSTVYAGDVIVAPKYRPAGKCVNLVSTKTLYVRVYSDS